MCDRDPFCFCRPAAAAWRVVLPPLRFVTSPYQNWLARREALRVSEAERRRMAEAMRAELAGLHERLWDHLPAAVDQVRTRVRTMHTEERHHA